MAGNIGELAQAAKYIAAGIAVLSLYGVGTALGNLVSSMINALAKNPAIKNDLFTFSLIGLAFTEAIGLFALVIAFLILFT